jgi:hypothetical protein
VGNLIMITAVKKVPGPLRRLAVAGVVAGIVATAVVYSRGERATLEDAWLGSKLAFQQPNDPQQAQGWFTPTPRPDIAEAKAKAEGWFTPTSRPGLDEIKAAAIENTITPPQPRPRPSTPGSYYELVRAQGDGEGNYVLIERKCIPKVDMPEPCYLPERGRRDFPLRRE